MRREVEAVGGSERLRCGTKIVATIGPASRTPVLLRKLIEEGVSVMRLNFSHGDPESHEENLHRIRAASEEVGRPVGVQVDLQGPKLRVGELIDSGVVLKEGEEAILVVDDLVGRTPDAIPVQNADFARFVGQGDRILLSDGTIELEVKETTAKEVYSRVLVGGQLTSNQGINVPGVAAELPDITEKDRRDVACALEWGVDWVALSFVRSADAIHRLRSLIQELSGADESVPIMAKIEKPQALKELDAIIEAADAVMVARGDLGIEIPTEKVPMAQKRIIEGCNRSGVPVLTATQMLDSMVRNPRPTRAEASDVANAILDGTDAVMLSGETSIGDFPAESVRTMMGIIKEVEASERGTKPRLYPAAGRETPLSTADAVGRAARDAAEDVDAAAIIAPTVSGYTARVMSRYRPQCSVVAVTPNRCVQRRLTLYWGVIPLLAPRADNSDEIVEHAVGAARQEGLVRDGDKVVVTAGAARSEPGTTNLMRIYTVGEDR